MEIFIGKGLINEMIILFLILFVGLGILVEEVPLSFDPNENLFILVKVNLKLLVINYLLCLRMIFFAIMK